MKKIVLFGSGARGVRYCNSITTYYPVKIVAVMDSDPEKWGMDFFGYTIQNPENINKIAYDEVVITTYDLRISEEIKKELVDYGVKENKIIKVVESGDYLECDKDSRMMWIEHFARWVDIHNIEGSVAECGVYRGDSAKFINKYFKNRKLYLFDTFEGFNEGDLLLEVSRNDKVFIESEFNSKQKFKDTSIRMVMNKMTYPQNVIVKQGFFPESAEGVNDKFCFVHLDMDLYKPMYEGLKFFWDKMTEGGVILCHDYIADEFKGVKQAVSDFEDEVGKLFKFPISCNCSVAIMK